MIKILLISVSTLLLTSCAAYRNINSALKDVSSATHNVDVMFDKKVPEILDNTTKVVSNANVTLTEINLTLSKTRELENEIKDLLNDEVKILLKESTELIRASKKTIQNAGETASNVNQWQNFITKHWATIALGVVAIFFSSSKHTMKSLGQGTYEYINKKIHNNVDESKDGKHGNKNTRTNKKSRTSN